MKKIEFSEMTHRLHRNMVASAAAIIGIKSFGLQIEKAGTFGLEIKNFTTGALVYILLLVLLYNAVAYAIRTFEEYRIWALQITESETLLAGIGIGTVDLSHKLSHVAETLKKITESHGGIHIEGQTIFTKSDADALIAITGAAQSYAKGFQNFPTIVLWRFWGWDIGIGIALTVVAIFFAFSLLPSGHDLFCRPA